MFGESGASGGSFLPPPPPSLKGLVFGAAERDRPLLGPFGDILLGKTAATSIPTYRTKLESHLGKNILKIFSLVFFLIKWRGK